MLPTITRRPLSVLVALGCLMSPLPGWAQQPASGIEPSASAQKEGWTVNLRGADLRAFIDQVSEITGQTFIVDPRVQGQVTVISSATLSMSELYQLFLSVMATHGYSVLAQGDVARIVPNAEARTEAGGGPRGGDLLETAVIQLQQAPATELIPLIRPLIPQYGHLAAVPSANALIISDRSANIRRLRGIIRDIDQGTTLDYGTVTLEHGWAMDIAEVLRNTLMRGPGQEGAGARIIADSRTNRLIFIGPPSARERLASLARTLDVPATRSANTRVIRLRHNDAEALAETLGALSPGLGARPSGEQQGASPGRPPVLVRADPSLNAVVLLAEPDMIASLESIVRQLDVPRAQVLVEAAIVEVSGDITDALGVQWAIDARGNRGGAGGVSFGNTGLAIGTLIQSINNNQIPSNLPDGAIIGIGTSNFGALITALSANSNSNLLSTPSLLTLDNEQAEILVGQNVPFQTGSFTTDAAGASNPFTTIERQDIGVTLRVIPHINEGGNLRLQIEQEISSLAPSTTLAAQAVDLITNKRSIKSTVLAENGQIIVLGGLIQDDITRSQYKVPLLGNIPVLGALFRSTRESHVKRNLMVFIRPTVVRDGAGIASLTGKKYSDIRVIEARGVGSTVLPGDPSQLFDGRDEVMEEPAIDLRQPRRAASDPAPSPSRLPDQPAAPPPAQPIATDPVVSAAPAPAPAPAIPNEPATAAARPAMPPGWSIQLASVTNRARAQSLEQQLRNEGFSSYSTETEGLIRVFVGPVQKESEANWLRYQIERRLNLNGFVLRVLE